MKFLESGFIRVELQQGPTFQTYFVAAEASFAIGLLSLKLFCHHHHFSTHLSWDTTSIKFAL